MSMILNNTYTLLLIFLTCLSLVLAHAIVKANIYISQLIQSHKVTQKRLEKTHYPHLAICHRKPIPFSERKRSIDSYWHAVFTNSSGETRLPKPLVSLGLEGLCQRICLIDKRLEQQATLVDAIGQTLISTLEESAAKWNSAHDVVVYAETQSVIDGDKVFSQQQAAGAPKLALAIESLRNSDMESESSSSRIDDMCHILSDSCRIADAELRSIRKDLKHCDKPKPTSCMSIFSIWSILLAICQIIECLTLFLGMQNGWLLKHVNPTQDALNDATDQALMKILFDQLDDYRSQLTSHRTRNDNLRRTRMRIHKMSETATLFTRIRGAQILQSYIICQAKASNIPSISATALASVPPPILFSRLVYSSALTPQRTKSPCGNQIDLDQESLGNMITDLAIRAKKQLHPVMKATRHFPITTFIEKMSVAINGLYKGLNTSTRNQHHTTSTAKEWKVPSILDILKPGSEYSRRTEWIPSFVPCFKSSHQHTAAAHLVSARAGNQTQPHPSTTPTPSHQTDTVKVTLKSENQLTPSRSNTMVSDTLMISTQAANGISLIKHHRKPNLIPSDFLLNSKTRSSFNLQPEAISNTLSRSSRRNTSLLSAR
ncbi:hypothetical protein BASA50_008851 [Batrachochytrium salamandrivorans]|uniref:Myosin-binding domain-containing protein n=1 Tax=Batrachochytrium salamandrivorans TaxID=1357716 RepID=A0ABQ8F3M6_9FUNG|nr:hypothetical protein BASA50_008851 [Batrachochytrium salamandrivorans]